VGRSFTPFRRGCLSRPAVAPALQTMDVAGRGPRRNYPTPCRLGKFLAVGQALGSLIFSVQGEPWFARE